jgi:23S rRNA-intervening sequence protein
MQDFKKLAVWQAARSLTKDIYQATAGFPMSEEYHKFLDVAMGSACELECELILACDLSLVTESVADGATPPLVEIKRMLAGLIASLVIAAPRQRTRSSS